MEVTIIRFYIMTDMEGVSGVVDFDSYCSPSSPFYEKAKRLTTLEVNSAVEGILATGNHEVVVCDGHGAGAIDIDLLHKDASLILGRPLDMMFEMDYGKYDGFLMVGQHAMKDAPNANLDHTYDHVNIIKLTINGTLIGEAGVNALRAGIFGIPTIYLSGDEAACKEIGSLIPGVHTFAVKRGIKTTSAICLQPEKARDRIRETVANAVNNMHGISAFMMEPPYEAVFEFTNQKSLLNYIDKPYCEIMSNNRVCIYANDLKTLLETNLWGI